MESQCQTCVTFIGLSIPNWMQMIKRNQNYSIQLSYIFCCCHLEFGQAFPPYDIISWPCVAGEMMLNTPVSEMLLAWQWVQGQLKRFSELPVGMKPRTSAIPVKCFIHWARFWCSKCPARYVITTMWFSLKILPGIL